MGRGARKEVARFTCALLGLVVQVVRACVHRWRRYLQNLGQFRGESLPFASTNGHKRAQRLGQEQKGQKKRGLRAKLKTLAWYRNSRAKPGFFHRESGEARSPHQVLTNLLLECRACPYHLHEPLDCPLIFTSVRQPAPLTPMPRFFVQLPHRSKHRDRRFLHRRRRRSPCLHPYLLPSQHRCRCQSLAEIPNKTPPANLVACRRCGAETRT